MKRVMTFVSLVLATALIGCGGDEMPMMPPGSSGGAGDPKPSVPLSAWVHAMVTDGLEDGNGKEDTVEDKIGIVIDTENPTAFDEFLGDSP